MKSTDNAVEIKNLIFSYGETPVIDLPQLEIKESEFVFLFGPSGSGKSTLLELMAGVLKSQAGELRVCGQALHSMSLSELDHFRSENVGYIFQSFNLIPYLSVLENIILPFLFQKTELDQNALTTLTKSLGLTSFLNRPVSQLSVGQQQRVAVARALIKKPKIILADEPTSALDYNHRENFLKILFELCRVQRTSVLFVSHDLSIAKLFDRSISLVELNKIKAEAAELL